jgi:hypothetical protein
MYPVLVPEQLVYCFKFFEIQGQLKVGMRYRSELYKQMIVLDITQRQHAYSLAWAIRNFGSDVVITRSQAHYRVWIKLGYNANLIS